MRGFQILIATALLVTLSTSNAKDIEDYYFWNYLRHPYQTYFLEDYCGPPEMDCSNSAHTININSTGSGSALIVRGFRKDRPDEKFKVGNGLKCCITVKTRIISRLQVQLDEIYLKQKRLGERCENFIRLHGISDNPGLICGELKHNSFGTPKNEMQIEYNLSNKDSLPEFQKIKLVVTSAAPPQTFGRDTCRAEDEQWQCDNNNCIWRGFACDTLNNCGDWSDEFYCGFFSRNVGLFAGIAAGLAVIAIICLMCCCCKRCCCRKSKPKPFVYVQSFAKTAPNKVEPIYPSLDGYQRGVGQPVHMAPPSYSETQRLVGDNRGKSFIYQPNYGGTAPPMEPPMQPPMYQK